MTEYSRTFKSESGTEVEMKIKTECSTEKEIRETLSFIAQSSHRFYLDIADKIKNKPSPIVEFTPEEYECLIEKYRESPPRLKF